MKKVHPDRELEHEYITSDISIHELCRRHGIRSHSPVVDQAKKRKWAEKREQYQAKASDTYIEKYAARQADREAQVRDRALDAIDEATTRFRVDLKATKPVRRPDGSVAEEPAWHLTPRDLALLIDRFQVLFERPSVISQHQGLTVTSELSADALREFVEATRGRAGPSRLEESPLPRRQRLDD